MKEPIMNFINRVGAKNLVPALSLFSGISFVIYAQSRMLPFVFLGVVSILAAWFVMLKAKNAK